MKRKQLKQILLNFYSTAMADMILRGIRKPSYEIVCKLDAEYKIPFSVWLDIKTYIENNTECADTSTTTNKN